MTFHQLFLFGLLAAIFAMLIWGRFRYDAVAFVGLVAAYLAGVVPKEQVFSGFGHPATVIVALALIASRGLSASGAVEAVTRYLVSPTRGPGLHIAIMSATAATLSAGMNNVAALALLMPVDIQAAAKAERSPAVTLMPLSFATILGGMITLIGTPPNVVVATFRQQALGETFHMFDFAPVGVVVALAGILFVAGAGWRLIPREPRKHDSPAELLDLGGYIAEARVPEGCKAVGNPLRGLYRLAEENDVALLGIVRRGKRLPGTGINEAVRKGDHLVLEGGPEPIEQFVGAAGLKYRGSGKHTSLTGEALALAEVVVPGGAPIEGRSAEEVRLLNRHGVTLLGVSRRGRPFRERVRKLTVRAGDVLLLLGPEEQLAEVTAWLGALPLAERGLQVVQRHKAGLAVGIFTAAIIAASLDWIYLPVALATVAVAFLGFRILSPFQLYEAVEWPVIVLLGSLIPIGAAMETSGTTRLIADLIVGWTGGSSPVVVLAILMVVTMTLSDVLNNVATALIAAPIAVDIATRLGVNPDPFLMAVAVAASCAFLTPIGHKNNTLILGPGGYRFGDYWRMGLPLEALVVAVGLPMILHVWPL